MNGLLADGIIWKKKITDILLLLTHSLLSPHPHHLLWLVGEGFRQPSEKEALETEENCAQVKYLSVTSSQKLTRYWWAQNGMITAFELQMPS